MDTGTAGVARFRSSAADAAPARAALYGVNAAITAHLPDEETKIVPVMEHTITEAEVEWFSLVRPQGDPQGLRCGSSWGEILAAQPDGGDEWLHKHMPAPGRLAWRWIGRRKYAAHRVALEGR